MKVPFSNIWTAAPPTKFLVLAEAKDMALAPPGHFMQLAVAVVQAVDEMQERVITSQMKPVVQTQAKFVPKKGTELGIEEEPH